MDENICSEINRINESYKKRDNNTKFQIWENSIYHPRHPIGRLFFEHNYNILIDAINTININLYNLTILDVGCGEGAWLRLLIELGANPENLAGIDISKNRIETAKRNNPAINWINTDGVNIPFENETFDIVMQVVVFSSILDKYLVNKLLTEMHRVLKKGGHILWIDHKRSHSKDLSGYTVNQLIKLLPECSLLYKDSVHPRYMRYWHRYPWFCRLFYQFSRTNCDSWFLIFKKNINTCS